jgi:hypothetical protein
MVNRIGFLFLLLTGAAVQAATLTATLDRHESALGEPVTLTLQARDLNLETLDTAPLDAGFEVVSRTLGRSGNEETLTLLLYPRQTGEQRLPSLHAGAMRTRPLGLKVKDFSEQTPHVDFKLSVEPSAPRVNEPARLTLEICDDGSLEWQRPVWPTRQGVLLRALGEEQVDVERDAVRCTARRYFWAALATQPGEILLQPPSLNAGKFGTRLRYPAPALRYAVAPLPAWLPAWVPPGKPAIQADPVPDVWPLHRPLAWRFMVKGAYSAEGLRALLDMQTRGHPLLRDYPPLIEAVAAEQANDPTSRFRVTLFILPRQAGEWRLPSLRLPWFDAASGQLASYALPQHKLRIFNPLWRKLGWGLAGLAAVLGLAGVGWTLHRAWRWRWARHRGLKAIRQAEDPAQLVAAVRKFSLRPGQTAAATLGAWLERIQAETRCADLSASIQSLQTLRYGPGGDALQVCKARLLGMLRRASPAGRRP